MATLRRKGRARAEEANSTTPWTNVCRSYSVLFLTNDLPSFLSFDFRRQLNSVTQCVRRTAAGSESRLRAARIYSKLSHRYARRSLWPSTPRCCHGPFGLYLEPCRAQNEIPLALGALRAAQKITNWRRTLSSRSEVKHIILIVYGHVCFFVPENRTQTEAQHGTEQAA